MRRRSKSTGRSAKPRIRKTATQKLRPAGLTVGRSAVQRGECVFYGESQAEAEAELNKWKKANAKAVSIIAQIIERPSAGSSAFVIKLEYESEATSR